MEMAWIHAVHWIENAELYRQFWSGSYIVLFLHDFHYISIKTQTKANVECSPDIALDDIIDSLVSIIIPLS